MTETELHEGPAEITAKNVQYWCHHAKELKKTQTNKALKYDGDEYPLATAHPHPLISDGKEN